MTTTTTTAPEQGRTASPDRPQKAVLYRMVMEKHLCPMGLKSRHMLDKAGYAVEDHWLTNRSQVDAFKAEHDVKTTPQIFIGGERIGGYSELREMLGKAPKGGTSYQPVVAIFAVAALMALAVSWAALGTIFELRTLEWFVAISMTILGIQKLQDIESFSTMFLNYDLLAQRWVPYGKLYPFGETAAGVLMIAGVATIISAPIALFIGLVGAVSVIKAVYVDRRELKCACVGGGSNVPLGFLSLTENLMMIVMGLWMPARLIWGF